MTSQNNPIVKHSIHSMRSTGQVLFATAKSIPGNPPKHCAYLVQLAKEEKGGYPKASHYSHD